VLLDFGFLEPTVMTAIQRAAKSGGKLPPTLNGKLAVRKSRRTSPFSCNPCPQARSCPTRISMKSM
jgi:hypothetical protein